MDLLKVVCDSQLVDEENVPPSREPGATPDESVQTKHDDNKVMEEIPKGISDFSKNIPEERQAPKEG